MKKIKMIVTGSFILAVVGSALAFVPKFSSDFCVIAKASTESCVNQPCHTALTSQDKAGSTFYCTAPMPTSQDCSQVTCTNDAPIALRNE